MLYLTIPRRDNFDEAKQKFVSVGPFKLQLEHSLVSIAKWESQVKKAFLGKQDKTAAETIEYVKCMTVSSNIKPEVYVYLTEDNINEITDYINDPMTASIIPKLPAKPSRETVTAEIIYYWMIALNIPPEYQKWHLNRLLTLIEVCNLKNSPQKKMSRSEVMARNKAINDARRAKFNTTG